MAPAVRCSCVVLLSLAACGRFDFVSVPDANDVDAFTMRDVGPNATYPEVVLASGPRMYYRLNEADGSDVAADASGHGFTASYLLSGGTIAYGRPGALVGDGAVRMDGDGNSGPIPGAEVYFDPANMSWAGDFTVELFYVPSAPSPAGWSQVVFLCEDYMTNGFRLGWNEVEQLHLWTTESGATTVLGSVGGTFDMTTFHHVAAVRQGQNFTLYVDAIVVGSGMVDYVPVSAAAECGFGAFHGMPAYSTYDEVAIYDRALSQVELASHVAAR